jgi:hypothetical protein
MQNGEKARHNRDLPNTGKREAEKDHVARHVRHKHMAQAQVTERVDEAGHRRQADQQHRQWAMRAVSGHHVTSQESAVLHIGCTPARKCRSGLEDSNMPSEIERYPSDC